MKNFEFKVRVAEIESFETKLHTLNPEFKGEDHQVDTYFNVKEGRLKLREGNIENALIHYNRSNLADFKQSDIILYKCLRGPSLKKILLLHLGIKTVVDKTRKIYFIGNVKFHFDDVKSLGFFVEVEAIDREDKIPVEKLKDQCERYFNFFGFRKDMLIAQSYSDLLL